MVIRDSPPHFKNRAWKEKHNKVCKNAIKRKNLAKLGQTSSPKWAHLRLLLCDSTAFDFWASSLILQAFGSLTQSIFSALETGLISLLLFQMWSMKCAVCVSLLNWTIATAIAVPAVVAEGECVSFFISPLHTLEILYDYTKTKVGRSVFIWFFPISYHMAPAFHY